MASSAVARAGIALALSLFSVLSLPFGTASDATAAPARAATSGAADPAERSLAERRAVRGVAVDDAAASESPELREIRRFEEPAFPKPGSHEAATPGQGDGTPPPPTSLPGEWGGSGDVPAEVRSPQPARPADGATRRRPTPSGCGASSCPIFRCAGTPRCSATSTISRAIRRGTP